MGFSVTGNLLPGSEQRPEIATVIILFTRGPRTVSVNCKLNRVGFIPIVSTITGGGRALLGIVHAIGYLACAIFAKNQGAHLQEAWFGAKNIGRGLIEAIPIIGNITMFVIDRMRIKKHEIMAQSYIEQNRAKCIEYAILFIDGQEKFRKLASVIDQEMGKLEKVKSGGLS